MKAILFFGTFLSASFSFGQLIEGPLMDEGRKMITVADFTVIDVHEGVMIFDLSVDRKGNVAGVKSVAEGTTVNSTPAKIKATNYVKTFKFQEGTYYPEFHHVTVKVTLKSQVK